MKINVKMLLLITVFICSFCTGSAYADTAKPFVGTLSFNPAPPFWPGEHVEVTAHVDCLREDDTIGPLPGVSVLFHSDQGSWYTYGGLTDSNGNVRAVYVVPDRCLIPVDAPWDGKLTVQLDGNAELNGYKEAILAAWIPVLAQPSNQFPEFPSVALPVVAVLGMIAIIGHRKE